MIKRSLSRKSMAELPTVEKVVPPEKKELPPPAPEDEPKSASTDSSAKEKKKKVKKAKKAKRASKSDSAPVPAAISPTTQERMFKEDVAKRAEEDAETPAAMSPETQDRMFKEDLAKRTADAEQQDSEGVESAPYVSKLVVETIQVGRLGEFVPTPSPQAAINGRSFTKDNSGSSEADAKLARMEAKMAQARAGAKAARQSSQESLGGKEQEPSDDTMADFLAKEGEKKSAAKAEKAARRAREKEEDPAAAAEKKAKKEAKQKAKAARKEQEAADEARLKRSASTLDDYANMSVFDEPFSVLLAQKWRPCRLELELRESIPVLVVSSRNVPGGEEVRPSLRLSHVRCANTPFSAYFPGARVDHCRDAGGGRLRILRPVRVRPPRLGPGGHKGAQGGGEGQELAQKAQ